MLEIQKYLATKTPEQLKEEYAINYKPSIKYPNLILFGYHQFLSPMEEKICREARGIILDAHNNWQIVSMSFEKFFNFGEKHAAKLDWEDTKAYYKLDGSLMSLYYYNGEWQVASSGRPDASGGVGDYGFTYAELFWRVFKEKQYKLPEVYGNVRYTYMFELETPYNRIVVDHKENKLTLLGARELNSLQELEPEVVANLYGWDCVKTEKFDSIQELCTFLETTDPFQLEGFVLKDSQFNRLKVKSDKYIALHHSITGTSKRGMVQVILSGEIEECKSVFKNFGDFFDTLVDAYENLVTKVNEEFLSYSTIENQKEFAEAIKNHKYKSFFFNMRNKKINNVKELMVRLPLDNVIAYIDAEIEEQK